jgi:DNA-binding response OmpR family regulator
MEHILIVEDEIDIANLVAFNLERAGYKVSIAADGREGRLELLGDPPGGLGPERLALLRHLAWVLVLVDDG